MKLKRLVLFLTAAIMIFLLFGCSEHKENKETYDLAILFTQRRQYLEAYKRFVSLGDYKDSFSRAERIKPELYKQAVTGGITTQSDVEALELLGDYEDALVLLEEAKTRLAENEIMRLEQAKNREKYEEAIEYYSAGLIDDALESFSLLPETYQDAENYIKTISAIMDYRSGNWIQAAQKFDELNQLIPVSGRDYWKYISPVLELFFGVEGETNYAELLGFSLYAYYSEQNRLKNDITLLPDFPYLPYLASFGQVLIDPSEFGFNSGSIIITRWSDLRHNKLVKEIEERGLEYYYRRTDASVSPVEVTGTGIYFYKNNNSLPLYGLKDMVDPFDYAETPEDVRYIIHVSSDTHETGKYENGQSAYTTTAEIIVKDTVTGEILFSESYIGAPPFMLTSNNSPIGRIDEQVVLSDILPVLKLLVTVYASQG